MFFGLKYLLLSLCRLELAFKDALKKCKLYSKVESLLSNLYANYKNYLQRANLKSTYRALNTNPVMPTRIGGTRWLGHTELALKRMLQGYPAFVSQLDQVNILFDFTLLLVLLLLLLPSITIKNAHVLNVCITNLSLIFECHKFCIIF